MSCTLRKLVFKELKESSLCYCRNIVKCRSFSLVRSRAVEFGNIIIVLFCPLIDNTCIPGIPIPKEIIFSDNTWLPVDYKKMEKGGFLKNVVTIVLREALGVL